LHILFIYVTIHFIYVTIFIYACCIFYIHPRSPTKYQFVPSGSSGVVFFRVSEVAADRETDYDGEIEGKLVQLEHMKKFGATYGCRPFIAILK